MKKQIILAILGLFGIYGTYSFAQDAPVSAYQNLSWGINVGTGSTGEHGGVNLTSPYFWNKEVAVRAAFNGHTFDYIPRGSQNYVRSHYESYRLGLVWRTPVPPMINVIHDYIEAGCTGLKPNRGFSDDKFPMGFYLKYGWEYISKNGKNGFYVEANGTCLFNNKIRAEKAIGAPYYHSVFQITLGFRNYFGK